MIVYLEDGVVEDRAYLEDGVLDVLAETLRHSAHIVGHFVHSFGQTVGKSLHRVGHVPHGAAQRVHERVHLRDTERFMNVSIRATQRGS